MPMATNTPNKAMRCQGCCIQAISTKPSPMAVPVTLMSRRGPCRSFSTPATIASTPIMKMPIEKLAESRVRDQPNSFSKVVKNTP